MKRCPDCAHNLPDAVKFCPFDRHRFDPLAALERIFATGFIYGLVGAGLGLLEAYELSQIRQGSPPVNSIVQFLDGVIKFLGSAWAHNNGSFMQGPPKVYWLIWWLAGLCLVLAAILDNGETRSTILNGPTVLLYISGTLAIGAGFVVVNGIIGWIFFVALPWLGRWLIFEVPGLIVALQAFPAWWGRHDPSALLLFISVVVAFGIRDEFAAAFSRNSVVYPGMGRSPERGVMASILQAPIGLFFGLYIFFVSPLASYADGALTAGMLGLSFGWFQETADYLLPKYYHSNRTQTLGSPYMRRLFVLGAEELVVVAALLFAVQHVVGRTQTVYAARDWQPTGLNVSPGDFLVAVNSGGAWSADPNNPKLPLLVGGQGYSSRAAGQEQPAYSIAPWGSLLAAVGYLPNADIYYTGRVNLIHAQKYGTLYLRMNDNSLSDNAGFLQVWMLDVTALVR